MNVNSLTSARCARLSVGELRSFCLLMPIQPRCGRQECSPHPPLTRSPFPALGKANKPGGAQAHATSNVYGRPHGYAHWSGHPRQRRSRVLLTEERRIQTNRWRTSATAPPMPTPSRGGRRREPEGTMVPSARSFGSFSAAGQKMNIKLLNQRALCAAVCR